MANQNIISTIAIAFCIVFLFGTFLVPTINEYSISSESTDYTDEITVSFSLINFERNYQRWKEMCNEYGNDKYISNKLFFDFDSNKVYVLDESVSGKIKWIVGDVDDSNTTDCYVKPSGSDLQVRAYFNGALNTITLNDAYIYERKNISGSISGYVRAPTYNLSTMPATLNTFAYPISATNFNEEDGSISTFNTFDTVNGIHQTGDIYKAPSTMNTPIGEFAVLYQYVPEIPQTISYTVVTENKSQFYTLFQAIPYILIVALLLSIVSFALVRLRD